MDRGSNPVLVCQRPDVLPMSYPCLWLHSTTCVVKVGREKRPKSPKGKDDDDVHVITINSTKFNFCPSSCARRAHVSCTFFAHFCTSFTRSLHVWNTFSTHVAHVFHIVFVRFSHVFDTFSGHFAHVFRTILTLLWCSDGVVLVLFFGLLPAPTTHLLLKGALPLPIPPLPTTYLLLTCC